MSHFPSNMYNNQQSSDLKIKPTPRFEKPIVPFPRNPGRFLRRPQLPLRRRLMAGRYPNMGFRPIHPPVLRPSYPLQPTTSPEYQCVPKSASNTTLLSTARSSFPNSPVSEVNHLPSSPRSFISHNENSVPVGAPELRNQSNESSILSDLWVEALAPGGRIYYFNARTRKTVWDKPLNVRIIYLEEINRLGTCSGEKCPQNITHENQNHFIQQQSFNAYNNSYVPRNCSIPPRMVMFQPSQNMRNLPTVFQVTPQIHQVENVQDSISYNFNSGIQPALFPIQFHQQHFMPVDGTISYNPIFDYSEKNEFEQNGCQMYNTDSEESGFDERKQLSSWSISESSVSLGSADITEQSNNLETLGKCIMEQNTSNLSDSNKTENDASYVVGEILETGTDTFQTENKICGTEISQSRKENFKSHNEIRENADHKVSTAVENEYVVSKETNANREEHIDNSRPVSCTPVSGTFWHIVWTGDERVFFYNSQTRLSVWGRPHELSNRSDVDKLIEKSPLTFVKTDKEARKTLLDGIKKLKTERKDEIQSFKDTGEKFTDENRKEDKKPKSEEIPHDRRVEIFLEMLSEKNISGFSSLEKELHKIVYDSRYLLLPSKERRQVFEIYASKKIAEEKNRRQKELHNQKETFINFLKEVGVSAKTRFADFVKSYGGDERFKVVTTLNLKENIFTEYVDQLIKKDREIEKLRTEQKKKFIQLLTEQKFSRNVTWAEIEKDISNDDRYKAIQSLNLKEAIFKDFMREKTSIVSPTARKERINASIRYREEEVKRDLSVHLKNREREQELHKHKSAMSDFKALLNDLIRDPDINWHSAKRLLKQDRRWDFTKSLDPEKREGAFDQHIDSLYARRRDQFHRLLDETPGIDLQSSWLDVRKTILNDPRCTKFSSNERRCEKEFENYLQMKLDSLISNFKELIRETIFLNYKSKSLLETTNHIEHIEKILSHDRRYLNLECIRNKRRKILLSYIDELHKRDLSPPRTKTGAAYGLRAN